MTAEMLILLSISIGLAVFGYIDLVKSKKIYKEAFLYWSMAETTKRFNKKLGLILCNSCKLSATSLLRKEFTTGEADATKKQNNPNT